MTAVITAIDRKAGTITVESSPFDYGIAGSMDGLLKKLYSTDVVQSFLASEQPLFGVTRSGDVPARLAGCRIGRPTPGTVSATAVVALTTLCAMEWLRHRKAAVAAAEASGDYSSLIDEFVAWLRTLFAEWRRGLAKHQHSGCELGPSAEQ